MLTRLELGDQTRVSYFKPIDPHQCRNRRKSQGRLDRLKSCVPEWKGISPKEAAGAINVEVNHVRKLLVGWLCPVTFLLCAECTSTHITGSSLYCTELRHY